MAFQFAAPASVVELPRNVALLDSNFIVALANEKDSSHAQVVEFLEADFDFTWILTHPVLVECSGLLSRRRDKAYALQVISWFTEFSSRRHINSTFILSDEGSAYADAQHLMNVFSIDYVDAFLIEVADKISRAGGFAKGIPIVTFDTGDFSRCIGAGYMYSIWDMRDFSLQEF